MMNARVGPVLRMSEGVEAVIDAITEDNPGKEVEVVDRGAYVRVQAEGPVRLTAETLARHLGRAFEMREFEAMMSAFSGRITFTSDEVVWDYQRAEDADDARAS